MTKAENTIYITANGQSKTAILASNASVEEFKNLLPLTIRMSDYGGWEKVGDLPHSICHDDRQTTARPGDIMLYQGHSIVIFYGENSWAYTPIGKIDNATQTEIIDFLTGSTVEVTFSLSPTAGMDELTIEDCNSSQIVYDLSGHKINLDGKGTADLPKGIYIINNKQTLIK